MFVYAYKLVNELLAELIEAIDRPRFQGVEPLIYRALKSAGEGRTIELVQVSG